MQVQPYLMFGGRCEEAVNFYRDALGAEIEMLMRFREAPDKPPPGMVPDNWDDKVMHCAFKVGPTMVMATDGGCTEANQTHQGYSLALSVANEAEAKRMATLYGLQRSGDVSDWGSRAAVVYPTAQSELQKHMKALVDSDSELQRALVERSLLIERYEKVRKQKFQGRKVVWD